MDQGKKNDQHGFLIFAFVVFPIGRVHAALLTRQWQPKTLIAMIEMQLDWRTLEMHNAHTSLKYKTERSRTF